MSTKRDRWGVIPTQRAFQCVRLTDAASVNAPLRSSLWRARAGHVGDGEGAGTAARVGDYQQLTTTALRPAGSTPPRSPGTANVAAAFRGGYASSSCGPCRPKHL